MKYRYSLFFSIVSVLIFTGCRTREKVCSTKAYKETFREVQNEIAENGYRLYDSKRSLDIDGTTQNTYKFQDTNGNTLEFTVMYRMKNDDDIYYVENVQVDGCVTSNGNDYDKLCGSESPIYKIEKINKDEKISHISAGKTVLFVVVGVPIIIVGLLFGIGLLTSL